MSLTDRNCF